MEPGKVHPNGALREPSGQHPRTLEPTISASVLNTGAKTTGLSPQEREGWERRTQKQSHLQIEKERHHARGSVSWRMLVPVATGTDELGRAIDNVGRSWQDLPTLGFLEQAERSQQSNHPGWQKLTQFSWERCTTSLPSMRADVGSEEVKSTGRIMTMLRVIFRA